MKKFSCVDLWEENFQQADEFMWLNSGEEKMAVILSILQNVLLILYVSKKILVL